MVSGEYSPARGQGDRQRLLGLTAHLGLAVSDCGVCLVDLQLVPGVLLTAPGDHGALRALGEKRERKAVPRPAQLGDLRADAYNTGDCVPVSDQHVKHGSGESGFIREKRNGQLSPLQR